MVCEPRYKLMRWMEVDYVKQTYFWLSSGLPGVFSYCTRLWNSLMNPCTTLDTLGIMGEMAHIELVNRTRTVCKHHRVLQKPWGFTSLLLFMSCNWWELVGVTFAKLVLFILRGGRIQYLLVHLMFVSYSGFFCDYSSSGLDNVNVHKHWGVLHCWCLSSASFVHWVATFVFLYLNWYIWAFLDFQF